MAAVYSFSCLREEHTLQAGSDRANIVLQDLSPSELQDQQSLHEPYRCKESSIFDAWGIFLSHPSLDLSLRSAVPKGKVCPSRHTVTVPQAANASCQDSMHDEHHVPSLLAPMERSSKELFLRMPSLLPPPSIVLRREAMAADPSTVSIFVVMLWFSVIRPRQERADICTRESAKRQVPQLPPGPPMRLSAEGPS